MAPMGSDRCVVLVPAEAATEAGLSSSFEVGDVDAWLASADAAFEARLLAAQSEVTGVSLRSAESTGQLGVGKLRLDPFVVTAEPDGAAQRLAVLVCSPRGNTGWDPADSDSVALLAALAAHVHPAFAAAELRCTGR